MSNNETKLEIIPQKSPTEIIDIYANMINSMTEQEIQGLKSSKHPQQCTSDLIQGESLGNSLRGTKNRADLWKTYRLASVSKAIQFT